MSGWRVVPGWLTVTHPQYEAFNGLNVRLRYFLRFTIFVRRSLSNIVKVRTRVYPYRCVLC